MRPRDTLAMLARPVDLAAFLVRTRILTYTCSFGGALMASSADGPDGGAIRYDDVGQLSEKPLTTSIVFRLSR